MSNGLGIIPLIKDIDLSNEELLNRLKSNSISLPFLDRLPGPLLWKVLHDERAPEFLQDLLSNRSENEQLLLKTMYRNRLLKLQKSIEKTLQLLTDI